jgi:uncharacterized protein (TIGR00251 family)
VHVLPRSGRSEIVGRHGDALKIRIAAPPVDGRATEAVRLLLATVLGVAPGLVTVLGGERSRAKRLLVEGMEPGEAGRRLAPFLAPRRG